MDELPGASGPRATPTRRRLLVAAGALASTSLAGCLGSGGGETLRAPVMGDPEADVTVAVYEDFACPHCREFSLSVLPTLREAYIDPGAVRYEHHDFPIPVADPGSWQAANAARAVQDRADDEAFWAFAHGLFENQRQLGPELYESLAAGLDLDGGAVRQAAVEERYNSTVRSDRQAGIDRGVEGTPTVFVDGQAVRPTAEDVSAAIDLARSETS